MNQIRRIQGKETLLYKEFVDLAIAEWSRVKVRIGP